MKAALIRTSLVVGAVGIAAWWILHNHGTAVAAPVDNSFMLPNTTQTPSVPIFDPTYGSGNLLDTMPSSSLFAPVADSGAGGCGGNCSGCGCGAAAAQPYVAPQPYQIAAPVPVSIIPIQAIKKAFQWAIAPPPKPFVSQWSASGLAPTFTSDRWAV